MIVLRGLTIFIVSRSVIIAYLLPGFVLFQYLQPHVAESWLPLDASTWSVIQNVQERAQNWENIREELRQILVAWMIVACWARLVGRESV
jgi:hypothetical protein